MTDKSEWQGKTGEAWAQEWRRTDRSMSLLTEELLAKTHGFAFDHVLDIGCGAGELSLAIARGRPEAAVKGVDVSPRLIDAAKERGGHRGNLTFELADAAEWQCDPQVAPELLVSRHGVMFFGNPTAAFANLANQAGDGAGLLFSCFRERQESAVFTEILRLLPEPAEPVDPLTPGPFAFADPDRISEILTQSGWGQLAISPIDFPMIVGAGEDAVEDALAYFARIGPAARAATLLDTVPRERFFERVRGLAEKSLHGSIVALPAAAWIVTARKI